MYLDYSTKKNKNTTYTRVLLRESYRVNGKVKKKTIANLSNYPEKDLEAIKLALKHKNDLSVLGNTEEIKLKQGSSIGATLLLNELAQKLSIADALGNSLNGKLALWQVFARVLDQGSRLSAVRLAEHHSACNVLDLGKFDEESLYRNLDWIADHQAQIEDALFKKNALQAETDLFLYDVTSSYLEGQHNELAAYGYNRDGKKGKKQIVIGLLCSKKGDPVSVEVFQGNTSDTETFMPQVEKVAKRFGACSITFVGDKGMIKGPQIKELQEFEVTKSYYLTTITKAQIEKLIKDDNIQLGLFDNDLAEVVTEDGIRYILRRNPVRANEIATTRQDKLNVISELVAMQNLYLKEHPRAKVQVALNKISAKISKLKIEAWLKVSIENERTIVAYVDEATKEQRARLDGCYVMKTDLPKEKASKDEIHARYKDLALVESAFSNFKTNHLELRPIHVRLDKRTRAHVFVVMLAYKIVRELSFLWSEIDIQVKEGIKELSSLCAIEVSVKDEGTFNRIPEPRELSHKLLKAAKVKLPTVLSEKGIKIIPRKNLVARRKKSTK